MPAPFVKATSHIPCPHFPSSSLPQVSSWLNQHSFYPWIYLVTTKSQVNRNKDEGAPPPHCGVGFSGCRRMAIATYSHQLHTRVRGSPPERRMPLLWERGNFKISDNQYATNLTSLDSDTSWRSVELLRLLLHLEGKLKTNFSYLTLQLTAVLVHEEASRSCLTWLMEAKILICPVKSKEHYSTFKAMCLQLGSLNHKSPRSSFLLQSPGVRDRQSLWDTQTNRGRERERDDPMSFPISFSCKMVSPENSVLTLMNLCETAVS